MESIKIIEITISVIGILIAGYQLYNAGKDSKLKIIIAFLVTISFAGYLSYIFLYPRKEIVLMKKKIEELQIVLKKNINTKSDNIKSKSDTLVNISNSNYILPVSRKLAKYEEKHAIFDKTLFVGRYYNEFIIGGKNLDQIKYASRTNNGEDLVIQKDNMHGWLKVSYWEKPYFEIEYNNRLYSIEVKLKNTNPVYTIKQIEKSTMKVNNYFTIK